MDLTSAQLWERIHRSGLATPELCRSWAMEIAQAGNAESLHDAPKLAGQLIRSGKLTPFQLNALMEPTPPRLSVGPYQIVDTLSDRLGPCWFEAKDAIRAQSKWCFQWTPHDFFKPQAKQWPPSVEMAKLHCRMEHPFLDRWESVIAEPGMLACFCEPVSGQSLASVLESGPLSLDQSVQLARQIGAALGALHETELCHGSVNVETIWLDEKGNYRLRRDPLFPPKSPYSQPPSACLPVEEKHLLACAAPEWAMPGCSPSEQIDLYALGCVWAHALGGKIPWPNAARLDTTGWKKTHQQTPILLPSDLPDSVSQCIRHLVAKNPASRFSNAASCLRAIEQIDAPNATSQVKSANESPKKTTSTTSTAAKSTTASLQSSAAAKPLPPASVPKPVVADTTQIAASVPSDSKTTDDKSEKKLGEIKEPAKEIQPIPAKSTSQNPLLESGAKPNDKPLEKEKPVVKPVASVPQSPSVPSEKKPADAKTTSARPASEPRKAVPADTLATPASPQQESLSTGSIGDKSIHGGSVTPAPATPAPTQTSVSPRNDSKSVIGPKTTKAGAAKGAKTSKGKKKKKKPTWLLPALAIGSTIFVGLLLTVLLQNGDDPIQTASGSKEDQSSANTTSKPNDSAAGLTPNSNSSETKKPAVTVDPLAEYFQVKSDDGQLLWAPPTAGSPQSLELLPPGAEAIVFLSAGAWEGHPSSEKLQSWWLSNIPGWSSLIGKYPLLQTKGVQQVTAALYPSKTIGVPDLVLRLTFKESFPIESLLEPLEEYLPKDLAPTSDTKRQIWSSAGLSVAFDELSANPKAMTKRVVIGPSKIIESLGDTLGGVVPLRRQMDALLQVSDSRSDIYVIAAPSFLFGDAREVFSSTPFALPILKEIVDDSVQAISFASYWQPKLYLEYRMVSTDTKNTGKLAGELKQKLEKVPDTIEAAFVTSPPPSYWRALATRYPQMLRSLSKNARFGVEEGQIAANVYLPAESLSNLTVATWMSLQPIGTATTVTKVPNNTSQPSTKLTVDQMLDAPMNIAFEQESLEMGLAAIGTEFNDTVVKGGKPIRLTINGSAFQKEGITQNQQIRAFVQKSVPLRTVLTDLVRRANPVTTVKSPTEKDQKVVWVVLDDEENTGEKKVELTTRTWAESNKATLPKEFVP